MARIHVTYTGGTIGMVEGPCGLEPGTDLAVRLRHLARAEGNDDGLTVSALHPLIDSASATPASWQTIIDDIHRFAARADAFVVLHGTDTMAYTAAALSFALTVLPQPVILTGSQLPLGAADSDAPRNLADALAVARTVSRPGVYVVFGGRLLCGNRVSKVSSWAREAFDSPSVPPIGKVDGSREADSPMPRGGGWPDPEPFTCPDIAVLDLVPGIAGERMRSVLTPLPDGVVLRAYGMGNVPAGEPELDRLLTACREEGVPVVVTSQCLQASVALGRYRAGAGLARAGAVGAGDMTFEAAYAKLVFLLSQGLDAAGVAAWMPRSIAGEVTETH
ncbi:MAG: asparaginase [Eggerthellaceae bacterium]|jgi:L-asparaginase